MTTTSKTIRRNSKAIRSILSGGYTAKVYSLGNEFRGEDCSLEWVAQEFYGMSFATARQRGENVVISIHSNLWYSLTPEPAFA